MEKLTENNLELEEKMQVRPGSEILVPDWLITSHVILITSSDWLFTFQNMISELADLEALRDLNEELEEQHVATEKELREVTEGNHGNRMVTEG